MSGHLHADAVALLDAWTPGLDVQDCLRQAYLAFLAARADACSRACSPGHLTASAVVLSPDLSNVALVLHGIVGAWLPPGGHLERDDASLVDAAAREVREELGLTVSLDAAPLVLDCHAITCRGYSSPTRHLDVCFAGVGEGELLCSAESHEVRWWPVADLPTDLHPRVRDAVAFAVTRLA